MSSFDGGLMNDTVTTQLARLLFVHPDELHAYWPYVEPRLQSVKRKMNARWIPADVYAALKGGVATLHIAETVGYAGFIVLQPLNDYDGKTLWVWVVFSEETFDVIARFESEIDGYARKIGAKRLAFSSPREWERRLPSFKKSHYVYEKEV